MHADVSKTLIIFNGSFEFKIYFQQDIFYLFDVTQFPLPMIPTNSAILTRNRMVRMWTNFAGNYAKFIRKKSR